MNTTTHGIYFAGSRKLSKELRSNLRPLDLTPFETVERYLSLTHSNFADPEMQKLRKEMRENALNHDISLGFFP